MRKDSEKFLRKLLEYRKRVNQNEFKINYQYFEDIPSIKTAIFDILEDLIENNCLTSQSRVTGLEGNISINLTLDGITYFDDNTSITEKQMILNVYGGQLSIASDNAQIEAIQNNQSQNVKNSSQKDMQRNQFETNKKDTKEKKKKVFISYSWVPASNKAWVVNLANRLEQDGVQVVVDYKDLKLGHDIYSFMQRAVNDETIDKVLIICNSGYKYKADSRQGGVGDESAIITPQIYGNATQEKFIPVVNEKDENGKPFLPNYLASRLYADLTDFENGYNELLKNILEVDEITIRRKEINDKKKLQSIEQGKLYENQFQIDVKLKGELTILMIGNGFDLAHGLPTRYSDFLKWVIHEYNFFGYLNKQYADITQNMIVHLDIPKEVNEEIRMKRFEDREVQRELWKMIDDNVWLQLFFRNQNFIKENWIDLESEIRRVIHSLDDDMTCADENTIVLKITEPYLSEYFLENMDERMQEEIRSAVFNMSLCEAAKLLEEQMEEYPEMEECPVARTKEEITYKQLLERLESDFNRLIRALEIYLCEYVNQQEVTKPLEIVKNIHPDYVLSFNCTNTYERVYGNKMIEYDYINGKANIYGDMESNNIVIGIDKDFNNRFNAYNNFFQRIQKNVACKYREWVDKIRDSGAETKQQLKNRFPDQIPFDRFAKKYNLYIIGHSLDITDKNIIRYLILNDNMYTRIYYENTEQYKQQIDNLIKIIGLEELDRRRAGNTKTIEFIPI